MRNNLATVHTLHTTTPMTTRRLVGKRCKGTTQKHERCRNRSAAGHRGHFYCSHHEYQAPASLAAAEPGWFARNSTKLLVGFMVAYFVGPAVVAFAAALWFSSSVILAALAAVAAMIGMFGTLS